MLLFALRQIRQHQRKEALTFQVEREEMARRPAGFPDHRIMRGVLQIMTVARVEIKPGEGFKLRERRGPERIHLPAQQRRTFGHHAQAPRAGQGFEVRPDLDFATPEHLEGLEKIAAAAHVGEDTVHALGEPVPIRFGGTVANRGGVGKDRAQWFKKLGAHFRGSAG